MSARGRAGALTPGAYVGCSGWTYRDWKGRFYPEDLPQSQWLEHYARHFDTVEINGTFYRLPQATTFQAWRGRVHARFVFAVKASRYLTHLRRLRDPAEPVARLFERAEELGPTLGPVLYQLPPQMPTDAARLRGLLELLPPHRLHVLEFRNPSWYEREVLDLLERPNLTLCLHDMRGSATGARRVGGLVYLRLHGNDAKYSGEYRREGLEDWAAWLAGERDAGRPVYVYFNNDVGGAAVRDAQAMREMLIRAGPG